jgi:hypothetical protein
MSGHPMAALVLAAVVGGGSSVLAAENHKLAADGRERGPAATAPIKLFEGREAGPNELYRFCVIDVDGRLHRCPGP